MIEDFSRKHETRGSSDRNFGLVSATFLAATGFWPLRVHKPVHGWELIASAAFLLTSLAKPSWLGPLNKVWTAFGRLLGRVMNPIIMGLLFFLVLTPIGLLMRVFGRDALRLARRSGAHSYWIARAPDQSPGTMTNQY